MTNKKTPAARTGVSTRTAKNSTKKRTSHNTKFQTVHDAIKSESAEMIANGHSWHLSQFPALAALLKSAKAAFNARICRGPRPKGRILFLYEGKRYLAGYTGFGRVIVYTTAGNKICSSACDL